MKITDNTSKPKPVTVTLNNIPVGTTFRGTVKTKQNSYTGVFYKAEGVNNNWKDASGWGPQDVIVVRLDTNDVFHICHPVENYEPVNVEVVIS